MNKIMDCNIENARVFLKNKDITLIECAGKSQNQVWKGYDNWNKREVAIKMLYYRNLKGLEETIEEFQIMKRIKSSNVIEVYDFFQDKLNRAIYLIVEYCQNGDLNFYCKNNHLSKEQILKIFNQILIGIQAIHEKNIIHSDLKPQNITLSKLCEAKIIDFGISMELIDQCFTQKKGYTDPWAPFEQINQNTIYKQSDIYSAGAILCYLCGLDLRSILHIREEKYPDISNHEFKSLLQVAFGMMNKDYLNRTEIKDVLDFINQELNLIDLEKQIDIKVINKDNNSLEEQPELSQQNSKELKYFIQNNDYNLKRSSYFILLLILILLALILKLTSSNKPKCSFKQDLIYHKKSTLFFQNGDFYQGDILNCQMEGYGVYEWGAKQKSKFQVEKYEGQFKADQKNGQGTCYYAKGQKYVGEWLSDKRHGQGVFEWGQNSELKGQKYKGYYKNDKWNGEGTFYLYNGDLYVGKFLNNYMDGEGVYKWGPNQKSQWGVDYYEGQFKEGFKNGNGTCYYTNNEKYVGEWQNDLRHGEAIYYFQNGDYLKGKWQNDKKMGQFIYYSQSSGIKQNLIFNDDIPI